MGWPSAPTHLQSLPASNSFLLRPLQDETDEVQRAELRMAAATAVLRLARRHDRRLPPAVYTAACLTVQDPSTDNRRAFAGKLRRMLQLLAGRPLTHHLSAKYAAARALSAMDPVEEHQVEGRKVGGAKGVAGGHGACC
jgi:hypothetical protein